VQNAMAVRKWIEFCNLRGENENGQGYGWGFGEDLIRKSFQFPLDRESKESILRSFNL
jgi:hypothetical protein